MKKKFMQKHDLSDAEFQELITYEEVRKSGICNMFTVLPFYSKKLRKVIFEDYKEFLNVLKEEKI